MILGGIDILVIASSTVVPWVLFLEIAKLEGVFGYSLLKPPDHKLMLFPNIYDNLHMVWEPFRVHI